MYAARATGAVRDLTFAGQFFSGTVLDIGCGDDLVAPHARPFDLEHGDANCIRRYIPHETFNCVHSSHCLEHMRDPVQALSDWWSLVRPGGYLVTVVPDEDLYEQGYWPSRFNDDHKWTFRLGGDRSWSPVSHDIRAMVSALPAACVLSAERQDHGYDHQLRSMGQSPPRLPWAVSVRRVQLVGWLHRRGVSPGLTLHHVLSRWERAAGVPIDQTMTSALAQIQVVAQKSTSSS